MEAESRQAPKLQFHTPGIGKADLLSENRFGDAPGGWARKGVQCGSGCGDGVP